MKDKKLNDSSRLLLAEAINSGITSPKELANLMGNADVETSGFTRMHENHRYSSAANLIGAVSSATSRFSMDEINSAIKSRDAQQIFKVMYEGRKDLGNTESGDGYKYHGRGYLQYTGRYNYTKYGNMFGVDLVNNPDLAAEPKMAARLAVSFWKHEVPQELRENVRESAKIINGGTNGMNERISRSQQWATIITPELIKEIQTENNKKIDKSGHDIPSKDKLEQSIPSNTNQYNDKDLLVKKLIDKAKGEIGYTETGNNNTKYAQKHIPSAQNKAWCDTFVDSMFIEAYGRSNAQKMLGGIAPGTETSKENFQRMRLWHSAKSDYLPQPGDQIFFKNGENEKRTVDHTGIVVKVENGKVYTIEGNTSVNKRDSDGHGVESKVHNLKANNIVGYGTPNWDVLLKQNIQKPATEPEKTPEKQPAATLEKPVQEKHTQEKPEKAADKVEKKEKAELSSQLSPQVQKFSQQCEEKLVECCNKKGITADSPQDFKNISMALTVKGLENGMTKIGQLDIETKGAVVMVFIVSQEEHTKFASVSANDAVKIPVQESIEKIQQMEQQKTQEQQMQQSQTQGMQR